MADDRDSAATTLFLAVLQQHCLQQQLRPIDSRGRAAPLHILLARVETDMERQVQECEPR